MTILFALLVCIGFALKTGEAWRNGPTLDAFAWLVWFIASIIWAVGRF